MISIFKQIYERAIGHEEIMKLFKNFSWLSIDRIVRLGLNLFIVGWIARYLGREQYGLMNYVISFAMVAGAFYNFGTNNIIIREILRNPSKQNEIMGSSFLLRQIGGILAVVVSLIAAGIVNDGNSSTILLIFISSLTFLFGSLDVIDLYFQSQIRSKYPVIANNLSFILFSVIRVIMILNKAPLSAFVIAATAEVALAQMLMIVVYKKTGHSISVWRWDYSLAKGIMRDSLPLLLSLISVGIYAKVGQVMLGHMVHYSELGDYSAALKISEVWYFIPAMLSTTIYPKIIEYQNKPEIYEKRLQEFFSIMMLICYCAVIPVFFLRQQFIGVIFGGNYLNGADMLGIHIWTGVFLGMMEVRNVWCNVEGRTRGIFYSTLAGVILNIILNIPFIYYWGGLGAAASSLIARIFGGYLSTFFISRKIFMMQTKSIFLWGLRDLIKHDFIKKEI